MISYNHFVDEENGWKNCENGNQMLLLQDKNTWGTSQRGNMALWQEEAKTTIDPLWKQLLEELPTIDKVVMYVGSFGAERVIELAAANGLSPDRAVFVMCDCNLSVKTDIIVKNGFAESERIMCACGGHAAMMSIYSRLTL